MQPHVHTGIVSFLFAGISALIFFQLVRLAAAKMVEYPSTESVGKWLGALVTFHA